MRTTPLLLALLAGLGLSGPVSAGQTVWKWVDANGVTHYSDRPVPGATMIELSTGTQPSSTPAYSPPAPSTSTSPAQTGPIYRDFEIWQPGNDETVPNTGGQVTVNVRLDPSIRPGHSLALYLDGRLVQGYPGNVQTFNLQEVPRGTHTLVAVIQDGRGNRVQETPSVTFHVRQESVAQPPVGPTLRPQPPKPQPRIGNKLPKTQPSYAALNNINTAPIDPATNKPVVTKPATKPVTPKASQGK